MSSREFQDKFERLAKHLFTYFEQNNFQVKSSKVKKDRIVRIKYVVLFVLKKSVDILVIAAHHSNRQYSIDFYFNDNRIATDFKRNGNRAILTMEVRRISLNQTREENYYKF